jgi:uncharacterized FlaG/YvyC family protein
MEVLPISRTDANGSQTAGADSVQTDNLRNAFTAARKLNGLEIADREFKVMRDPASHSFVIVVMDRSTGTVLDQFPPEDVLKMLSQIASANEKQTGETSE